MAAGRPKKQLQVSRDKNDIDALFNKVEDEYDLIALVGKLSAQYDISMDAKDALKTIVKECVDFGYNLCIKESQLR